jgi:hypothetical protein
VSLLVSAFKLTPGASIFCELLVKSEAFVGLDFDESLIRILDLLEHIFDKKIVAWYHEEGAFSYTGAPLSLELLLAFVGYCLAARQTEVAVCCALMYHCISRTSYLFLIEAQHLVFCSCGSRASPSLPITISRNKRGGGSETVEIYDQKYSSPLSVTGERHTSWRQASR